MYTLNKVSYSPHSVQTLLGKMDCQAIAKTFQTPQDTLSQSNPGDKAPVFEFSPKVLNIFMAAALPIFKPIKGFFFFFEHSLVSQDTAMKYLYPYSAVPRKKASFIIAPDWAKEIKNFGLNLTLSLAY